MDKKKKNNKGSKIFQSGFVGLQTSFTSELSTEYGGNQRDDAGSVPLFLLYSPLLYKVLSVIYLTCLILTFVIFLQASEHIQKISDKNLELTFETVFPQFFIIIIIMAIGLFLLQMICSIWAFWAS